jgi:CubicO group peptidase (beta-lactamase class C family)
MTLGLRVNWGRDLSPQPDRVRDALSLPFDHKPGEEWQYFQSGVTLLANVVERSVDQDLQEFAQDELFGPIGIPRDAWTWDRDRAGNTEGWAHLHMEGPAWARLGHLMLRGGSWDGEQLISKSYLRQALTPVDVNNAYGFLIWLNRGGSYVLPDVEDPDEGSGRVVKSGPKDMLIMAGSGEQRVYVIPSRDLVIVRLGERGSREGDTRVSLWTGRGGEVDNELVRRVLLAVTDKGYKDPGQYPGSDVVLPPPDSGIVGEAQDVEEVAVGLGAGPNAPEGCTPLGCESDEDSADSKESDDDPAESVQRDAQDVIAGLGKE